MVFMLTRPSDEIIHRFLATQADSPFTYPDVGTSRQSIAPPGFNVDHNRILLGTGEETYRRAMDALRRWEMFSLGWVDLCYPTTPIETGQVVAVSVWLYGIRSLNAARIVYTFEEQAPIPRFGFAYGTLRGHSERGEERFSVEWNPADNTVWYDLYAFSRPGPLALLGYPFVRQLQKRFARESLAAMQRAVRVGV